MAPVHRPLSPMDAVRERQRGANEDRNRVQSDQLRRGIELNRQADALDRRSTDLRTRALTDDHFVSERQRIDYDARSDAKALTRRRLVQDSQDRRRERQRLDLEREAAWREILSGRDARDR